MRKLDVQIDRIADEQTRDAFDRLTEQLREHVFGGFKGRFMEVRFTSAITNRKVPHNLGFLPKDVILTGCNPVAAAPVFNYERFSRTTLDITVTAACTLRFFVGTYTEEG